MGIIAWLYELLWGGGGDVGGNGSVHVRLRGRHLRLARPCPDVFRVGPFRFRSAADAAQALNEAMAGMTITDQGAFVELDVPAFKRDRPAVDLPYEIHISAAPQDTMVHVDV